MASVSKSVRFPRGLFKVVEHRARLEKIDESTAIRQLLALGAEEYAIELFKQGKITFNEAAELAGVTVRKMVDLLQQHGVRGNVRLDQQRKSLEFVSRLGR